MATYTLKVRRYQPESAEGPYWEKFKVELDPSLSVLDGILQAPSPFGRPMGDAIAEAQIGQDFGSALDGLGALQPADHLRQHDIFQR